MQSQKGVRCFDGNCQYGRKSHVHYYTPDGGYVRFMVDKPKKPVDNINHISDDNYDGNDAA